MNSRLNLTDQLVPKKSIHHNIHILYIKRNDLYRERIYGYGRLARGWRLIYPGAYFKI